ncbi:MAG: recombinase family protein [Chloroflexota bacterium]|nr:recombinase family protein [Chloroflexota bacterium]MDE2886529.1 recombinase family protein [Chloroflexota bacterium]
MTEQHEQWKEPKMSKRPEPTPVALYARVSSDRQDVDLSVAAQLRALRDHAEKNGQVVVREYVDEAESGWVDDRPQFNKMIEEARSPDAAFREILVWKFSRFTRKREHAVAYKSMLRRRGVRVVSITENADDTPAGKLLEGIIESVDEFYSENLAQEVRRGMREAASRGFWVASRTPYGYNRIMVQDGAKKRPKLEPDEETAYVVKRIFELADTGKGMLDIARTLNNEGISSATGKLWTGNAVRFILANEVYTGTLVWGNAARDEAEPVRVDRAFSPLISKALFRRVNARMRSRAPKTIHPRRVGSSYMFSGLVKCYRCNTLLSGQDAKSGRFHYYVCQTLIKRGSGGCDTPRLNARRFEELIVRRIRSSILTEGIIGDLPKAVAKELDGLVREQRGRLETIESELADVRRRLGRLWDVVETTDDVPADMDIRIKANTERRSLLEASLEEAQSILSQRRSVKSDLEAIVARAQDMGEFLGESELSERKAFAETFIKELVVLPGRAVVYYTVPMANNIHNSRSDSEELLLGG